MSERQIISLSRKLNAIATVLTILTLANVGTLIRDHYTLEQVVKTLAIDHPRVEEMWWTTRRAPRVDDPLTPPAFDRIQKYPPGTPEIPAQFGLVGNTPCLSL